MARIQIVPLPTQKVGDAEHTPFIIVIDRVVDGDVSPEGLAFIEHETGASALWVTEGDLDAIPAVTLTDEQRDALLERVAPRPSRDFNISAGSFMYTGEPQRDHAAEALERAGLADGGGLS